MWNKKHFFLFKNTQMSDVKCGAISLGPNNVDKK